MWETLKLEKYLNSLLSLWTMVAHNQQDCLYPGSGDRLTAVMFAGEIIHILAALSSVV